MTNLYVYPMRGESLIIALNESGVSLGRNADNDLILTDPFSSSHHAAIAASGNGFVLRDLGSKNGVFVNGKKIRGEVELRKGDEIFIGSTRMVFDEQAATQVEMVEGGGFERYNTILKVRDILSRPVLDTGADRPEGLPVDLEKLRREQKFLSVLNEVSQALIYHMPLEELLGHVMDLIIRNIPMDRGVLMMKEGGADQLVPKVVRIINQDMKDRNIQVSRTILNTALARNSSILLSDVQADSFLREQASVARLKLRSAMCVPLWNNQDIIGVIYADRASLANPFTEDDLKLLTLLANVAAVKIENARLVEQALEKCRMEKELAVAAQIQRNLLPREYPKLERFEICGGNKGCFQIGGDYYDFITSGSDRLGIAIADVSGCGVGPALLMASLRASLHAESGSLGDLPLLASRLNAFVHKSSESNTFITFFLGNLNTETGEMVFVNAGHNPPFVLKKNGDSLRLESTGFCLGMFPDAVYEFRTVRLDPGDLLCLFTDGITEGRENDLEEYGEERLVSLLRSNAGLPVEELMNAVFADVRRFTACEAPDDDMTLVLVRRIN